MSEIQGRQESDFNRLLAEYATRFRALSVPVRLKIILLLKEREMCVREICEQLSLAQSRISYHLKVLLDIKLIEKRIEGTCSYYSLARDVAAWIMHECSPFVRLSV